MTSLLSAFDHDFASWRGEPEPWAPWRVVAKVLSGEELDDTELELFRRCTGRTMPFASPPTECWFVVGRRGRKSAFASMVAVHAALLDWSEVLAPGEQGRVLLLATDKLQASVERSYCEAILRSDPETEALIVSQDVESITLATGIVIRCTTNSFRSVRGPAVVCAVFGEVAFWRDDRSANPDRETLRAVRPGMLSTRKHGALLLGISSPYAKNGLLWERHRDHWGNDASSVLIWQADTSTMNPVADAAEIADAYADDPESAAAEYGAQFRSDVSNFLDAGMVEDAAREGPLELPPVPGIRYVGFCDPSGGRGDAFALCVGHRTIEGRVVVDTLRAVDPPFDPATVVPEFAALLKRYRVRTIRGDNYSGEWVSAAFRESGIEYRPAGRSKSDLYVESLPHFTGGMVELPPDRRLLVELSNLERRTARSGKDSVDHPRRGHDDRANAVCGMIATAEEAAFNAAQGPAIRNLRVYA